ncbi:methylenetetrahydrofolate reductase [NAD(P)H] [Roseinatronobacter sp. S2]|uniref:methylenetetrahydrofolate reductase [NAD(P)H] n=1 Tax=Roseinatronobacter sp. S2 TaxID=3035471 RepID=UPI0024100DC8|nr:methylenetetrahydrofolate reductase [NAD(P)H] [Roseinatronobacter sp. S2]WFE77081.1 methylenetetrahydrofolate reductase [NAD(P)H] [Roseinatronobacter sp. S2]
MTGIATDDPYSVSFELFPPKTAAGLAQLGDTVTRLATAAPGYFSVTYGAGGSTRDRTAHVVDMVRRRTNQPVAHHLTCVGASRSDIDAQARDLWTSGIRRIVALRGDLPPGEATPSNGYHDAAELVAGLRRVADFDISVAAYPEIHPEAASAQADLDHLKRKLDAGASCAITQYAFDTDQILRFIDRARAAGITAPIVPGIMPVANFKSLKRFSASCGASIPDWLVTMFDGLDDAPETRAMVATSVATEQCRRLIAGGVGALHIYTLNRAEVSLAICRALGMTPEIRAETAA